MLVVIVVVALMILTATVKIFVVFVIVVVVFIPVLLAVGMGFFPDAQRQNTSPAATASTFAADIVVGGAFFFLCFGYYCRHSQEHDRVFSWSIS